MAAFLDVCRFTPTLGGTTDWTVSAAVTGYQTPASAGAVNGTVYRYRAESADLTQWEVGYGAYTVAGTVLARTTVLFNSSGTTSKISFTATPQVAIVALGEDLVNLATPQGRVTLTTATPVMTATASGQTTVYYTPYVGNIVPIYDGSNFVVTQFSELSQATTDATKSPAAVAASKVYDIFVWNDAGTIRATRGPAWTNDTTRGYTLTMTNGILLNTSSVTNGPAALRGTFVGTIRSNASSTIDYIFGSSAAGGGQAWFGVWNAYNRVTVATRVLDSAAAYAYASGTVRQANASAANRISFVTGAAEDGISVSYGSLLVGPATQGAFGVTGFGLDSTTVMDKRALVMCPSAFALNVSTVAMHTYDPQLGFHFVQAMEVTDSSSWFFNNSTAYDGLYSTLRM